VMRHQSLPATKIHVSQHHGDKYPTVA